MIRWLSVAMMAFVLLSPMPVRAQSQATTGVIEGTVSDETGGRLPGAAVELLNTGTNFSRQLVTDTDGRFRGLLLPLGTYKLSVTLAGFTTYVQEGIQLVVGQTANIPVTLRVSTVEEAISVTADSPVVETTRAENSTLISTEAIRDLPNNGRNFLSFLQLTPGVTIVQGPDGDEISINGQKGINNNVSVDGADFNNPFFGEQRGGQRPAFTFNQDAVKELVVVSDGAAPEFGRSGAGFVNVVTKSGTNNLGGSAHFFFKADDISWSNSDTDEEFPFDQEQFGATVGGPLRADKLFYFLAYDEQRFRETKQLNPARIDQRIVDLMARFGSPDENGPIDRTNDARALLVKIDDQINTNNLLTVRYNYTWSRQENGTFDVDVWGRSLNGIERDHSNAVSGSLLSTISTNKLNEFRFQYSREDRPRPYGGPDVAGQSRPFPDTAIDFTGYRVGMPFFLPVEYYDDRIQLTNNFSIITGRHTIKFGGEYTRVKSAQTFIGFANGLYKFSSVPGFINYVNFGPKYVECTNGTSNTTGVCPAGSSINGPMIFYLQQAGVGNLSVEEAGTQDIPQTEPSLFVQDKWQPNSKLTIHYGIRWEAQLEPDPITPPNEVFYAPFIGRADFPSDGTIPSDKKMFQPRLGISYDPNGDGKQVIRLSAGIFYARVPGLNIASSRSTNGSRGQTLYRDSTFNGFGVVPPTWPNLIPQAQVSNPDHPDVFVFDKDFQNPRTYSGTISYERELIANLSFFANFTHSKTVHITRFINRNDPVFGRPFATGLGANGQNGIAALTTVESSAKSKYDGLTIGMNKKYSDNYQFQWNYTLSRDMSDDDNERDPFTIQYARADNLAAEYNYSDRDQRHRFNAWLLTTLKNFEINNRISARSAQPRSIGNSPADRIQANGTVIKRNTLRRDNEFFTWDVRVSRTFGLQNGVSIQPIFEVFNLTNNQNIRRPEVTSLLFSFHGTLRSGLGDPRQAQVGARILF